MNYFKSHMLEKFKTISKEDLDLIQIVDSTDEAMKFIMKSVDTKNSIQV
jgi:predicted Rossmann-fold nucleotide-binding protein